MPIRVEHITYTYMPDSAMSHTALNDVSFCVQEGEFWGIIGHTGSGKSTLVQHLNGLALPQSGRVVVDDLDMNDKKQRVQGRALVGMVFQYPEYQLFEETVYKDVAYGPANLHLPEEEIDKRVHDALRLVGLAPELFMEKSPFDLSGGEKRRVAIAGIVAMRPKYLILDEPMAGLDPRGRKAIMDMITGLRKETGCAIIMVSHSMDDIAAHADRVLVLSDGHVALQGTPEEVFKEAETLLQLGLDVPQAVELSLKLQQHGVVIPEIFCRMEPLEDWLRTALAGGDRA